MRIQANEKGGEQNETALYPAYAVHDTVRRGKEEVRGCLYGNKWCVV